MYMAASIIIIIISVTAEIYIIIRACKVPFTVQPTLSKADHSHIFIVTAVCVSNTVTVALRQVSFCATAIHLVQPNWTTTYSKRSTSNKQCHSIQISKLLTEYSSIIGIPAITAYRAPSFIVKYLNTALM